MTELYVLPYSEAERIPTELCESLFPDRMERARRFRRREDSLRCIGAGTMVALILGLAENEICRNEWGKPSSKRGDICFSLSHSGDYVLLAADESDIGADIEKNTGFRGAAAKRVLTPKELEWMNEDPEKRFYELWTMKESVMKLDGRGFHLPPESFCVLNLLRGGTIICDKGELYGYMQPFEDCTLSVCALHSLDRLSMRILTADDLMKMHL